MALAIQGVAELWKKPYLHHLSFEDGKKTLLEYGELGSYMIRWTGKMKPPGQFYILFMYASEDEESGEIGEKVCSEIPLDSQDPQDGPYTLQVADAPLFQTLDELVDFITNEAPEIEMMDGEYLLSVRVRFFCQSAIVVAAAKGDFAKVEELLAKGASGQLRSNYPGSVNAVRAAMYSGQFKIAELLLDHPDSGCSLIEQDDMGLSLLHYAAITNSRPAVNFLIKRGHPFNPRACDALLTPRQLAEQLGCTEAIDELDKLWAEQPCIDKFATWLHWGTQFVSKQTVSDASHGEDGHFLIEPSRDRIGDFYLWLSCKNDVHRFHIHQAADNWYCIGDGPVFNKLNNLVDYYSRFADNLPVRLHTPVKHPSWQRAVELSLTSHTGKLELRKKNVLYDQQGFFPRCTSGATAMEEIQTTSESPLPSPDEMQLSRIYNNPDFDKKMEKGKDSRCSQASTRPEIDEPSGEQQIHSEPVRSSTIESNIGHICVEETTKLLSHRESGKANTFLLQISEQPNAEMIEAAHIFINTGEIEELLSLEVGRKSKRLHFKERSIIGSGAFGMVYQGQLHQTGGKGKKIDVAVKKHNSFEGDPDTIQDLHLKRCRDFLLESTVMMRLHHPNIVELIGVQFFTLDLSSPFFMIQELCAYGLDEYVQKHAKRRNIRVERMCLWAAQIANGMWYLSKHQFVHRDLALRNVLLEKGTLMAKVSDFGMSRHLNNSDYYALSTPNTLVPIRWYATESLAFLIFTCHTDVWSYGVTLWELFSYGDLPYGEITDDMQLYPYLVAGKRLALPVACPEVIYRDVIVPCWHINPRSRPSFADIYDFFLNRNSQHLVSMRRMPGFCHSPLPLLDPQVSRPAADHGREGLEAYSVC